MTYTPTRVVTINNHHLTESTDMTALLSSFVHQESYLSVTSDVTNAETVISLSRFLTGQMVDVTNPLSFLSTILTDLLVIGYGDAQIPLTTENGRYAKTLDVYHPLATHPNTVHYTSTNTPTVLDDITLKGYLDDLVVYSDTDLSHCLMAVNGVFHKTSYDAVNNRLYGLDGFRTMRISGKQDLVLVDTQKLGGHTVLPLTSANVQESAWAQPALITLPQPLANQTPILVIDGYWYHLDQHVLQLVDSLHLKILTHKLLLIQQFRHNPRTLLFPDRLGATSQASRRYTDPYDTMFLNTRIIPTAALQTADFQYSRLTAFHSFLLLINTDHLYSQSLDVPATGTPRFYQDASDRALSGMANIGCGLTPSYLLWQDAWDRTSVFIPQQDDDHDLTATTANPRFVPSLISEPNRISTNPIRFTDYICA